MCLLVGEAGHLGDEAGTPPSRGVLEDVALQLAEVGLALVGSHGDGVVDGVGELFRVPGIDDEAAVEGLCGTGELGEDHDAVVLALGGDVFVRDEVHAVAGGGDETDVGDGVESRQFVKGDGLMQEVDGHELDGAEFAVDAADELVDDGAEVLVLFNILARGHGDLDEDNLANPFWVLGEEDLEGVEFLWHALDVVKTVDADDELDAFKLAAEGGYTFLNFRLLETLDEVIWVNADRKSSNGHEATLPLNTSRRRRRAQYPRAAAQKMTSVVVRMETDEVAVEQTRE